MRKHVVNCQIENEKKIEYIQFKINMLYYYGNYGGMLYSLTNFFERKYIYGLQNT